MNSDNQLTSIPNLGTSDAPLVMGILNVTPDSFSDGGKHNEPLKAVEHGLRMVKLGADIIDIGGESTRPGADTISTEEQLRRVIPVITKLRQSLPVNFPLSIDTTDIKVAKAAVDAGVNWLNDISAAEDSSEMLNLAMDKELPIVLMHRQGKSVVMQDAPHYDDVCNEVFSYLLERANVAESLGLKPPQIILDPGIGFGKLFEHNLVILKNLSTLCENPYAVLLGTSRKRFLSQICDEPTPANLAIATAATSALAIQSGVKILRVHDVYENRQAVDVAWAIQTAATA